MTTIDNSQPAPQQPAPAPAPATAPYGVVQFTPEQQRYIDGLMGQTRDEARRAAERAIAEKLGGNVDDVIKELKAARDKDAATMSEAERKLKEAADKEAALAQREADVAKRDRDTKVLAALTTRRVKADRALFLADLVKVDDKADDKAIAAAVETIASTFPESFEAQTPDPNAPQPTPGQPTPTPQPAPAPAPSSVPGPGTPAPQLRSDAFTRGAERAKALQGQGASTPAS